MKNITRVWIGDPYEDGHFNGTAFFIDKHTLVTAKHVVQDRKGEVYEGIYLTNTPDGGIIPVSEVLCCERDIALLKVKKEFDIASVNFSNSLSIDDKVNVRGYYDKKSSQKSYVNTVSGYQSLEHTYELQNHLTHGLSGSPVFLDGDICGVTKAINSSKNLTYIIPISEVCIELKYIEKKSLIEEKKPKNISTFLVNFFVPLLIPAIIILIVLSLFFRAIYHNIEISEMTSFLIVTALILAKIFTFLKFKLKGKL